ncbi:nitrate reductase subunit alpha [Clostridium sp. YIM B02551]|uniref:nitrate reductase subunit alpha n=1 Tax=Clostridium sp. YIM B02551 TaxID=2910679 RepID=UPI001EEA4621|nr:nitrate reductase subunit alpha [Clostridium sp. YIM B02551]
MSKRNLPILERLKYFSKREHLSDRWTEISPYSREQEVIYRNRWQHDKVVRSTHGVNCTGSCSWDVYVKDGLVTWELQRTDYPSTGPDMPDFEPRGCPRGATFSWYLYSPLRIKYPYIRRVLLELWRKAMNETGDPVLAWASIVENPEKASKYKSARGKGGFIRVSKEEAYKIISAALIYDIKKYGPDRIVGVSPIPAMSMISYAAGTRFLSLLGSPLMSFYDWYADLPPASPQIWGDQTDVPESSDWYNSSYIMIWGSNLPLTRTPDAHFMVEARYKGTKVVSVSPDYAEYVKFADNWLQVKAGTDGALAMAMGHVILKEFYIDKKESFFIDYVKAYTDMPFLIMLKKKGENYVSDRFLRASDLDKNLTNSEWKTIIFDDNSQKLSIPNGSEGFRWEEGGKWNIKGEDSETGEKVNPRLSLYGVHDDIVGVEFPYFGEEGKDTFRQSVPVKRINNGNEEIIITTVYDLTVANYGLSSNLEETTSINYDSLNPYTPAWQEAITGVDRKLVIQIAREFAENAIASKGRSMIIMGAGINHWYNSDTIYRAIINMVMLTGCEGVNGGGWAHYVGQEKLRPIEGWATIAFGKDWTVPPKFQNSTSFYYFATDQWRYENMEIDELVSPTVDKARYKHCADYNVMAARLGWLPSYPQFDKNSLSLYDEALKNGAKTNEEIANFVGDMLKKGELRFSIEDPDDERNFPKTMFVWRANLLSSSGKGYEYFLKHLLGADSGLLNEDDNSIHPEEVKWREHGAEGKLDLLVNLELRMSGTALYSDIVLPTATWYEKSDLSSTDMHPFVHTFNPAVAPQWESQSDWEIFIELSKSFSKMAEKQFDGPVKDVYGIPLLHDTQDEIAQPYGQVNDWSKGDNKAIPGKNMPRINVVERDYGAIYDKMISLGPNVKEKPITTKGVSFLAADEYEKLKNICGTINREGVAQGCPDLTVDRNACEAVLMLSSTTNGTVAVREWEGLEKKTSLELKEYALERAEERFTFEEITARPKTVITSPVFTGSEKGGRRYSPFTTNVEKLIPWHTLTGRQHFYLDHELILEFGEALALFKPPLKHSPFAKEGKRPESKGKEITVNYMTPHNKWSIHTMFHETPNMLTLFRGGPVIWINNKDAEEAEIKDNDWVECFNRNGVVVARAVVSHRLPRGNAYMYHAQDKTINVPGSKITNTRGGTHNSPTRIFMKPTHMIGGYSQLSYDFNYYGTTGSQRDLSVVIRKLSEVDWYED